MKLAQSYVRWYECA